MMGVRIGIIGIGGVGGYFGGKLAREYEKSDEYEIIFIARGEHLKAIQKNGLQLFTREGDCVVRPRIATNNPDEAGMFDVVFFCTKSYSLENSAEAFISCIGRQTVVIPLLNGVNSSQRLRRVLPHAIVLGGSVYIISHSDGPGIIKQEGGACKLTFGTDHEPADDYRYILDILLQAKINAVLTDDISGVLWIKYLLMCPLGSLTSSTGKTYGQIWENPELRQKARAMMMEVVAVAAAHHVVIQEHEVDKAMAMIAGFGYHSRTSMQLDFEKGRQTEIDALTAYLCGAGRDYGVPTPLHDDVYAQLKSIKEPKE